MSVLSLIPLVPVLLAQAAVSQLPQANNAVGGVLDVVFWVKANWSQITLALASVVAGASIIIKGLEQIVALLCRVFPGLVKADGELKHIAGLLQAASKSRFLNTMALSPSPVGPAAPPAPAPAPVVPPKAAAIALAVLLSLAVASPARADEVSTPVAQDSMDAPVSVNCFGYFHCGLAMSLQEIAPLGGLLSPTPVALGGGYQIERHFNSWDLAVAVFGNLLYLWHNQQPVGEVSAAIVGCLGQSFGLLHGACGGIDAPITGPEGGILGNWSWKRDTRVVFSLGPDLVARLSSLL